MKRILIAIIAFFAIANTYAQPPGRMKPPPPEKRWERDSKIIAGSTNFSPALLIKMKPSFYFYYKEMDAVREKYKDTRPPKEEMEKAMAKRSTELKKVLSPAEHQKFVQMQRELLPPKKGRKGEAKPAHL